jgi:hypothetical protein
MNLAPHAHHSVIPEDNKGTEKMKRHKKNEQVIA